MSGAAPAGEGQIVLRSGAEAVEVAHKLAARFAVEAGERDRNRRLPQAEVDQLSDSGLLGISAPARFGGADLSVPSLVEIFRLLAVADPNIAQIPHSHFVFLEALRAQGTEPQQAFFFGEALAGRRFANAQSERSGRTIVDDRTTLTPDGNGDYRLDGEKFYATGALFAHWLVVRASRPDLPALPSGLPVKVIVFVRADSEGVELLDDWDGMGQRTTASGTVRLNAVAVPAEQVVPFTPIFESPTTYGAFAQILHAAIDAGIARAAVLATVAQVGRARPWFESGADRAADDPLLIQQAGEVEITVRSAEALLAEAATAIQAARENLGAESSARASVATAVAKVVCARASVEASSSLFELAGTRSALDSDNLSRFWRDARTHTLHDPTRWKVQHVGRWVLSETPPPRHGLL